MSYWDTRDVKKEKEICAKIIMKNIISGYDYSFKKLNEIAIDNGAPHSSSKVFGNQAYGLKNAIYMFVKQGFLIKEQSKTNKSQHTYRLP